MHQSRGRKHTGLSSMKLAWAFVSFCFGGVFSSLWLQNYRGTAGTNVKMKEDDYDLLEGITFTELKESLVRNYASSWPDVPELTKAKEAVEAMYYMETDGDPVMVEGYPYLFIGSTGAAYNLDALLSAKITHIINLVDPVLCKYPKHFKYLHVKGVHDTVGDSIASALDPATAFIEEARLAGGRILIHCWRGKSRSASVIIAYLVRYHGMTTDEALALLRTSRPQADPNGSFYEQLKNYELKLYPQRGDEILEQKHR